MSNVFSLKVVLWGRWPALPSLQFMLGNTFDYFYSSVDENFYSALAANAEDGLSDVSEADVSQMAKSIAVSINLYKLAGMLCIM